MPYGIIYKVINIQNLKIYIGQTTMSLSKRKSKHYSTINRANNINNIFLKDLRIFKRDVFIWQEIDSADNENDLNIKEIKWIQYFGTNRHGYNCSSGGKRNFVFNEIAKKHFSDAWYKNPNNKIHLEEISKKSVEFSNKDIKRKIQINLISSGKKGIKTNEETVSLLKKDFEKGINEKEAIEKYGITRGMFYGIKCRNKWAWVKAAS